AQAKGEAEADDSEAGETEWAEAEEDNTSTKQTSKAIKFYKEFDIKKGVVITVEHWKEITLATIHHRQRNALPGRDLSAILLPKTIEAAIEAVEEAARAVQVSRYNQLQPEDVRELIGAEDMNIEEMIKDEDFEERAEREEQQEEVERGNMTTRQLTDIFALIEQLKILLNKNDGDEY
ncbi:hypothetical protein Hamer_G011762, partial [Homarus americanus]